MHDEIRCVVLLLINIDFIDATVPNMHHAFQTAEGLRKEGKPEWMQLVGLLHDLGKVLFLKGSDGHDGVSSATQYAVVGDTFIVGYPRSTLLVYPEYNNLSQCECENESPALLPKCGFDACTFSFGHDEYLYQVLMHNQQLGKIEVPSLFAYVVRYHSFHAWHQHEAYKELASPLDQQQVKWLREFVEYDLYTKSDADLKDANELKAYYETLMQKCLGCSLDDSWEF